MRTGWIPLFFPMYVSGSILPFSTGRKKVAKICIFTDFTGILG